MLTEREEKELESLTALQKSSEWMSQEQFERANFLRLKKMEGTCTDPHCKGVDPGVNQDNTLKYCPNCGSVLFVLNQAQNSNV